MRVRSRVVVWGWMIAVLGACGDDAAATMDAGGPRDAARVDAGRVDAARVDAGPPEPWVPAAVGDPASATIGPEGGSITSADGILRIDFPPGALAAATPIRIQGIEWPDGAGWSLTPDRLELAVPAIATITQPDGDASVTVEGAVTTVTMELGEVVHLPPREAAEEPPRVEIVWREVDGQVDYVLPLEHFSTVLFVADVAGYTLQLEMLTGDLAEIVYFQRRAPAERRRWLLVCPDVLDAAGDPLVYLSSAFEARHTVARLSVADAPPLERVGGVRMFTRGRAGSEYEWLSQEVRCTGPGEGDVDVEFGSETLPLDSIDVPAGCRIAESAGASWNRVHATCTERPISDADVPGVDGSVVSMDGGVAPVDAGPLPNGSPCTAPSQCTSRWCADGVCCNERCDSICRACVATKSRSPDGTCDALLQDTDPDDECPGPQTCQDLDPVPPFTAYCRAHFGDPCTDMTFHTDCPGAGYCSEGVCCDRVCGEAASALECHSCRGATRGRGTDGTCMPVVAGLDPFDECPGTRVCNDTGRCNP